MGRWEIGGLKGQKLGDYKVKYKMEPRVHPPEK